MAGAQGQQSLIAISQLCGWLYFLAWSASFYPQVLLNLKRRSTQGFEPDFPLLNILGFSCYTVSTATFLFSPLVRAQYAKRHPQSPESLVQLNDLAFGLHGWLMSVLVYSQFWPRLWGWEKVEGANLHINKISASLVGGCLVAVSLAIVYVAISTAAEPASTGMVLDWIDVVYLLSYIKLLVTVFKFVPQVVANWRRKSTLGWSIVQILFDLFGGILSLLQLVIDSSLQRDWSGLIGNPVKLGLATISLGFDVVFMWQHYVLYGPVETRGHQNEANLEPPLHADRQEEEPLLTSLQ